MKNPNTLSLDTINRIKMIVATSLASDDDLMEQMVLKGGNAIAMGYGLSDRPSFDLDYSIEDDFPDFEIVAERLRMLLTEGFDAEGLHLFDYKQGDKPKTRNELEDFWGGYFLSFKVIEKDKFKEINEDEEAARTKYALRLNSDGSPSFQVEISKHEYIGEKRAIRDVGGINIYMYLPELIVAEKIRALCQCVPEYTTQVLRQKERKLKARARDFYDIYILLEYLDVPYNSDDFKKTLKEVFSAKRVPHDYLKKIRGMYEVHKSDFISVQTTTNDLELKKKDFDFFFDYFMERFEDIFD